MDATNLDSDERFRSTNMDFKNQVGLEKSELETVYIRMDFFDFNSDFSKDDLENFNRSTNRNYLQSYDEMH